MPFVAGATHVCGSAKFNLGSTMPKRSLRRIRRIRILFSLACLYGRAAERTRLGQRGPNQIDLINAYQWQAVKMLRATLDNIAPAQRKAFWQNSVNSERDLDALLRGPKLVDLKIQYGK